MFAICRLVHKLVNMILFDMQQLPLVRLAKYGLIDPRNCAQTVCYSCYVV